MNFSSLKVKALMATGQTGSAAYEALRSMSMKAGTYIRDASVKTGDAITEGTKSIRESRFGAVASDTMSTIGTRAAEGGSYLYSMGNGVIGRFAAGTALTSECAKEAKENPCPRMVIMCCTALCSNGLVHEGLFTDASESEAGAALYRELKSCNFSRLADTSATPQVFAQALMLWLNEMEPEPLLTFKLVPALTSPETPRESLSIILSELPPANKTALLMLLDTCNRIAGNAAINSTDAKTLATALSPCLLWAEAPAEAGTTAPAATQTQPLTAEQEAVFVRLLTYMITNFRVLQG